MALTKKAVKKKAVTKTVTKKASGDAKKTKKAGSSSVKNHLKKLQASYKKAETMGAKQPEGSWDCRIEKFEIKENNGSLRALWTCKGLDSAVEGVKFFISCGLDSEQQLGFLKGAFATLNVEAPRDIMQLEAVAEAETIGLDVVVDCVHNDPYVNMNFKKVISDGGDGTDYEPEEPEDVIPEPEEVEPEEEVVENEGYVLDEKVEVEIEGDMYPGKITDFKDGKAHVEFEDGDSADVPLEDLNSLEQEVEPAEIAEGSNEVKREYTKADINKMSEDELEEVIDENDLDMDIDDHDELKKQRKAVRESLDKEGLLA